MDPVVDDLVREGTFHAVAGVLRGKRQWNSRSPKLAFPLELPLSRAHNDSRAVDYFAAFDRDDAALSGALGETVETSHALTRLTH